VVVLLGLVVAAAFGSGDFVGGRAVSSASTFGVLAVGQFVALAAAAIVAFAAGGAVRAPDIGLGAAAGVVNVLGLAWLYFGLAHGRVSVVAPLTAVVAALVPVCWALIRGERPSGVALTGAVLAIAAGAVIAHESPETGDAGALGGTWYALAGGTLLGMSFVFYAEAAGGSGFWPVLAARGTAIVVVLVALLASADRRLPIGRARMLALAAGALDVTAGIFELVALREGLLAIVAPVVALAPAFTVLLAWAVLRERMSRIQLAGFVMALAGLVLVAAG
jgi:drug/metabolite transporter (DMT)-like permease